MSITRSKVNVTVGSTLFIAFAWLFGCQQPVLGQGRTPEETVAQAKSHAADIEQLGAELVRILENEQLSPRVTVQIQGDKATVEYSPLVRIEAAKLLPALGYRRGIEPLIKNIDLKYPALAGSEELANPGYLYPCTQALISFGEGAVYPIAQSARTETDSNRLFLLGFVMRKIGANSLVPKVVLDSLIRQEKDRSVRQRLQELLRTVGAK